jgi:16S rRNA (cytosine967-C5)-methyltransferase
VARGAPFSEALDRAVPGLTERDRRLTHELASGVLRRRADLDQALDLSRADPRLHDILRLGAYQLRWLTRVPAHAAVSTSVELARETVGAGATGYVNQELRRLAEAGGAPQTEASHPTWLEKRWTSRFGAAETERLIAWNDTKPSLTLQPARVSIQALTEQLLAAGIGMDRAPFDMGVRIAADPPTSRWSHPADLPGYAEGAFIVQDPAASLVCQFAALSAGTRVYDGCAAPGGKSVTLERQGARVVAGDARRDRLGRLTDTTRRAGVAIQVLCADLLSAPFSAASWDAVLVDAPCTATGTMAHHPDARWRITPDAITRAAGRQRALLDAAASLVRAGGTVVYATCSLELEENEEIVEEFLQTHPDFGRAPVAGAVPAELVSPSGDLQTLPQRDGIDGAYAARLARRRGG